MVTHQPVIVKEFKRRILMTIILIYVPYFICCHGYPPISNGE